MIQEGRLKLRPLQIQNFTGRCRLWSTRHERERFIRNIVMVEQQKTNGSEGAAREIPYDVVIPTLDNELQDRSVFWFEVSV